MVCQAVSWIAFVELEWIAEQGNNDLVCFRNLKGIVLLSQVFRGGAS